MNWLTEFSNRIQIVAVLCALALFLFIIELLRRNRLKEKYALLWIATCLVVLVLALRRSWLVALAEGLGIYYPPTALLIALIGFLILILVHYSTVISKLITQNQTLTQKLAILELRVRDLEKSSK